MSEVSSLKLKLNAMEKDRLDFDRFRDSEVCGLISRTHTHKHTPSCCLSGTLLSVSKQLCVVKITK